MQHSILRLLEMSMYCVGMELSHIVKLSMVARNRTQANIKILKILLRILSRRESDLNGPPRSVMALCVDQWCFTKGCPACFVLDPNIERQSCGEWVGTDMEVVSRVFHTLEAGSSGSSQTKLG